MIIRYSSSLSCELNNAFPIYKLLRTRTMTNQPNEPNPTKRTQSHLHPSLKKIPRKTLSTICRFHFPVGFDSRLNIYVFTPIICISSYIYFILITEKLTLSCNQTQKLIRAVLYIR